MVNNSTQSSTQAKKTDTIAIRIPATASPTPSISSSDISACESSFTSASSSLSSFLSSFSSPPSFKNTIPAMSFNNPTASTSSKSPAKTQHQKQQQTSEKIPRPPNSFLIYRKEHATQYAGLVATELSSKLALAWRRETPERRDHYAQLAEKAKQDHAIRYPNYKFTPVKRGTGKRALALKAKANAARKAAAMSTSTGPVRGAAAHSSSSSSNIAITTTASTTSTNRPKRSIQRPQRYTVSAPYTSRSRANKGGSAKRVAVKQEEQVESASLYFASYDKASWATPIDSIQSRTPYCVASHSSSSSSSSSHSDSDDDSMDLDRVKQEDSDDETLKIHLRLDQLRCQEPYQSPAETLSLQQQQYHHHHHQQHQQSSSFEDVSIIAPVTFPAYLSMEPFEPECLPRFETQWATTCSPYSVPLISSSSSSSGYDGYSTPDYEEMTAPTDHGLLFRVEMDSEPTPMSLAVTSSPFVFAPTTSLPSSSSSLSTSSWSFPTPFPTPGLCQDVSTVTAFPFGGVQVPSPPNSSPSGASSMCSSPYSSPLPGPSFLTESKLDLWL